MVANNSNIIKVEPVILENVDNYKRNEYPEFNSDREHNLSDNDNSEKNVSSNNYSNDNVFNEDNLECDNSNSLQPCETVMYGDKPQSRIKEDLREWVLHNLNTLRLDVVSQLLRIVLQKNGHTDLPKTAQALLGTNHQRTLQQMLS
ncbi:hypothetical protein PV328_012309, partial [Microctonus aethiopoides]